MRISFIYKIDTRTPAVLGQLVLEVSLEEKSAAKKVANKLKPSYFILFANNHNF